jgi:hypothetical protein
MGQLQRQQCAEPDKLASGQGGPPLFRRLAHPVGALRVSFFQQLELMQSGHPDGLVETVSQAGNLD